MLRMIPNRRATKKIRYAVVGLGHIAQVAVLPAFAHAGRNAQLTALVSGNSRKLQLLGKRYKVSHRYSYAQYDECLRSGAIDAVYIALPNHLHCDFAVRAAQAGIHILCEKPLALTQRECRRMIDTAERHHVRLMTAYRLHFDEANLSVIRDIRSGVIGKPRMFQSVFSMQVKSGNIRTKKRLGGGTLWDIGIYCINAARYLFGDEPTEVFAKTTHIKDRRFRQVEDTTAALLRFPDNRLAMFTCSFASSDVSAYQIVGTKGDLRLDAAYEYALPMTRTLTIDGRSSIRRFKPRDQFAPQLLYFSDCILADRSPEPSGVEGLLDVGIIRALYRSAEIESPVKLPHMRKRQRPSLRLAMSKPRVRKPALVQVASAS
ncbi:MAG TPA: Gfo/Idh/MocA family oxidoreductase, partial [Nitrospiraceae bacterium]